MSKLITYRVGNEEQYMLNGQSVTRAELDEMREKNRQAGYRERMAGYYDKWYRRNTFDNGASYDEGCMQATKEKNCPYECNIIECAVLS